MIHVSLLEKKHVVKVVWYAQVFKNRLHLWKNMYLTIVLLIKQVYSDISYNFRYLKGIKRRIESDKSK